MNRNISLSKRLILFAGAIMVPLTLMVIYLIISLISYGEAYNNIVENIAIASEYNFAFREQLDYTMYRIVVNEKTYADLEQSEQYLSGFEGDRLRDPYQIIHNAQNSFGKLLAESREEGNKTRIDQLSWIVKSIGRMEEIVVTIEENVRNKAPYRENEKLLNNAVFILTETTQEAIQQYIQNEAAEMEQVRITLKRQQDRLVMFSCCVLAVIFTVNLILSKKITESVTGPIKKLCEAADAVAQGDFASPTEIDAGDELQILTKSFNHMKIEIGRLIDHVKEEQDNLRKTELKLLQAQINPHFLYNTLDAIVWMAESGQNKEVVSMVTSLSEFFRTGLSKGQDIITVREEVSHVEHYLRILQFRYQDILEYDIAVNRDMLDFPMLKLTLQPVVENALYHGIKNKRGKGTIRLCGEHTGNQMVFQISDNGAGMPPTQLEKLRRDLDQEDSQERAGFGLANVNERIKMIYGEQYGVDVVSAMGEGTTVIISLSVHPAS